ncbi:MAG: hypothetical protein LDL42_17615 [Rhizobium sp.]|nr:hypothetical protein [Rhizobium sp.]
MAKIDHPELERAREERHEARWRIVGTLDLRYRCDRLNRPLCRNRSCRRNRICSGPMLATPRQGPAIARERDLGLSGTAVACLPLCIVNAEAEIFDHFVETTLPQIDAMLSEGDPLTVEYCFRKPNRRQRRLDARLARDHPDP